jgi:hypothetical protein
MSDFSGLYSIRDYAQTDKAFVMSTFLRGLYYGESWFSEIPKSIFMNNYKHVAEKIVEKSIITIACLPDDPDVILGYSILSQDLQVIHWVYVKSIWRRKGIAKNICPKHPTTVTHLTQLGKTLMKEKLKTATFNPFCL